MSENPTNPQDETGGATPGPGASGPGASGPGAEVAGTGAEREAVEMLSHGATDSEAAAAATAAGGTSEASAETARETIETMVPAAGSAADPRLLVRSGGLAGYGNDFLRRVK